MAPPSNFYMCSNYLPKILVTRIGVLLNCMALVLRQIYILPIIAEASCDMLGLADEPDACILSESEFWTFE